MIGIEVGDQVVVSWGHRQSIAIGLTFPDSAPSDAAIATMLDSQGVERLRVHENLLQQDMNIHVASRVRAALGIPATTVVRVRRRLRTYLINRIGRAVLPLGGLIFAALAVPGDIRIPAIIASSVVFLIQLVSLRYPKPSERKWPFW
jgi:hypothetical protein